MPKRDRVSGSSGPTRLPGSVRSVIILLLALAVGAVTSVLLWATAVPMAEVILGGIASSSTALQCLDKIIEASRRRGPAKSV